MFALAVGRVTQPRRRRVRARRCAIVTHIDPEPSGLGAATPGREHHHRRVVGVELRACQHVAPERYNQRVEQLLALADPASQRGAFDRDALAGIDAALAVERLVVAILGHQHVGQQPRAGHAARNGPTRRCRVEDGFARHAGELGMHVADHLEARGHILQLFRDVLADLAQPPTTGAAAAGLARGIAPCIRCLGPVHMALARQVRGQAAIEAFAVGGLHLRRLRDRRKLVHRQVCDQCKLRVVQLFAGGAEVRSDLTQQLHLELVDEHLEHDELGITRLYDTQQRVDGVGCVGGVRHAHYYAIGATRG